MTQFADCASSVITEIIENELIARETMRLRICVPEMASTAVPGQFFMLRNSASSDPLIGRALALYDTSQDESGWIDLVYIVKGKLTSSIARLGPGNPVALWGPLGNGFPPKTTDHLIMVAGGVGQTPFLTLAREALGRQKFGHGANRRSGYAKRVSFCYGVRSSDYLAGVEQFVAAGCEVHIATEDGTHGPPRRVTDPLEKLLAEIADDESTQIVCCGPEPMMEAVSKIAIQRELPCYVSLETPMACGIGICFTCVAKVGSTDDWDYKRTCVEGPVLDARTVVWS